jgi:hypothetical protein
MTNYKEIGIKEYGEYAKILPPEYAKQVLRDLRQKECFAYADRPLWYNNLSQEQKTQVDEWYNAWLNVTTTFVIPEKPSFIK